MMMAARARVYLALSDIGFHLTLAFILPHHPSPADHDTQRVTAHIPAFQTWEQHDPQEVMGYLMNGLAGELDDITPAFHTKHPDAVAEVGLALPDGVQLPMGAGAVFQTPVLRFMRIVVRGLGVA